MELEEFDNSLESMLKVAKLRRLTKREQRILDELEASRKARDADSIDDSNSTSAKSTELTDNKNSNDLDFKFGAYCDFRDYIAELNDDPSRIARALEILYEADLSDYPLEGLLPLYNSTIETINNYEPTDELTWNGYSISWVKDYRKLTVGETITLLEFDQRAEKDQSAGFSGNIDYNLGLEQLAVLLRREGEKLPLDPGERIDWIDRRKHEVADAPLWLVLNTRFFFIKKYREYLTMDGIDTYLTVLKQLQLMSSKTKQKQNDEIENELNDGDGQPS